MPRALKRHPHSRGFSFVKMVSVMVQNSLITILGPTSTGKTSLALNLCKKFNGEIISADSRQVYKYADVGTNKQEVRESGGQEGVRIHLYDVVEPDQDYSVARFVEDANQVYDEIVARGRLPFLVGGTGFYINAFLGKTAYSDVPPDHDLRSRLKQFELVKVQEKLRRLDKSVWQKLNKSDKQNPRRLIRFIELAKVAGSVKDARRGNRRFKKSETRILTIGLRAPREVMYKRADNWAQKIVESSNLIDETRDLLKRGYCGTRLMQGMIYAPAVRFIDGETDSKTELIEIIQGQLHAYIRRQIRWFRRDKEVVWVDVSKPSHQTKVENLIQEWYSESKPQSVIRKP